MGVLLKNFSFRIRILFEVVWLEQVPRFQTYKEKEFLMSLQALQEGGQICAYNKSTLLKMLPKMIFSAKKLTRPELFHPI